MTTKYIAETKWRVQLQTGAPKLQSFEKILDAPSQQVAIYRAQAQYPNMQFVNVAANQVDPQTGGEGQQQTTNTPNGTGKLPGFRGLQPPKGLTPLWPQNQQGQQGQPQAQPMPESLNPGWFRYPYSISLPAQFRRLLSETAPSPIINHDGRHSLVLETAQQMREFLTRLTGHPDRRAVHAIVAGIRSSLV